MDNAIESLDAVSGAVFRDDQNPLVVFAAVPLFYVLGEYERAESLAEDMWSLYPGITAENPILDSSVVQPIDRLLANRRDAGEYKGPATVAEILLLLQGRTA